MSTLHKKHKKLKKRRIRNIILNLVCIALVGAGIIWTAGYFSRYLNYEITNDAVVDQYVSPVNIRVGGYIERVCFTEHRRVKAGDTLLVLDDREYRIKLKDAEAALLDARASKTVLGAGIEASRENAGAEEAAVAEAKARLWQLEQAYLRFGRLLEKESVSRQQYEQAKADYEAMSAHYNALLGRQRTAESQYAETIRRTDGADAAILRREADLDLARLNLSYTVVTAPYDGYTGRRTLEPGQLVQAGQTLTYLIRSDDKWITANYKETQIARIYIGQKVLVRVDAFRDRVFHGTVTAISEATGSKYALVPTDNSAGNFVKVQQRIPVRIDLDDASPEDMRRLRAGMMAETQALKNDRCDDGQATATE